MPPVSRLGDSCSGHGPWSPRPNVQGSNNVFVNGKPLHRTGDAYPSHCVPLMGCHSSKLASGSSTVIVNGKGAGRIGDPVACGGVVIQGSSNVFAGG